MPERRVSTHRSALHVNSVPNIETTLTTARIGLRETETRIIGTVTYFISPVGTLQWHYNYVLWGYSVLSLWQYSLSIDPLKHRDVERVIV